MTQTGLDGKWSARLHGHQGLSSSHRPWIPDPHYAWLAHCSLMSTIHLSRENSREIYIAKGKKVKERYLKNPRPHKRSGAILSHRVVVAHKLQKPTR
jgi:hypothetical protein